MPQDYIVMMVAGIVILGFVGAKFYYAFFKRCPECLKRGLVHTGYDPASDLYWCQYCRKEVRA
jgi:hypothetical protein